MHCDLVYASADAKFLLPFANLGLTLEAACSLLLSQCVGPPRAAEMLLLGESFSAQSALDCGLINSIQPDGKVLEHTLKHCRWLLSQPLRSD